MWLEPIILLFSHDLVSTKLHKELSQFIRFHSQIIELCEEFHFIVIPIVFTQFMIASLQMQICVVAIHMTIVSASHFSMFKHEVG